MATETDVKVYKVFVWRNPMRGEVAVAAANRKEAEKLIRKENPAFATLMLGDPLEVDPTVKGMIVHRWRRY